MSPLTPFKLCCFCQALPWQLIPFLSPGHDKWYQSHTFLGCGRSDTNEDLRRKSQENGDLGPTTRSNVESMEEFHESELRGIQSKIGRWEDPQLQEHQQPVGSLQTMGSSAPTPSKFGVRLNPEANSVRQDRHEVGSKEASTWGPGKRNFADGFQEVRDSTKKLLQAFQQIRSDLQEWREEIEGSTQEIVPSKVAQVGDGSFLDAHNLLEEMPMGDGSAKLQELNDFEPLKVTSLPLLEVSDIEFENKSEWVADPFEPIGLSWDDVLITSTKALDIPSAYKLLTDCQREKLRQIAKNYVLQFFMS